MNLGVDLDGCLDQFNTAYMQRICEITGVDKFGGQTVSESYPDTWFYAEAAGYTKAELGEVWRSISKDENFWLELPPMEGAEEVVKILDSLRIQGHNIYFVTSRPGATAKRQSEIWLMHYGMAVPTVLIADDKATALTLLKLDAYVDDRLLNANNCMAAVRLMNLRSRVYLVHRAYNDRPVAEPAGDGITGENRRDVGLKVVASVVEMLREEGLA